LAAAADSDCHTGGYQARVPSIPKGSGTYEVVPDGIKRVYMVTDKGPQQQWLWEIGKSGEQWCVCDGWTPQNAAHLLECPWVGDGKGRTSEMIWEDERWCEAVPEFIAVDVDSSGGGSRDWLVWKREATW